MRISHKQIKELQALLLEMTGKEYSPEEAQTAGLAIVRFVSAKELQKDQLISKEIKNNGT
jgi:enoyl-CoA hydratase/carnithine racemase